MNISLRFSFIIPFFKRENLRVHACMYVLVVKFTASKINALPTLNIIDDILDNELTSLHVLYARVNKVTSLDFLTRLPFIFNKRINSVNVQSKSSSISDCCEYKALNLCIACMTTSFCISSIRDYPSIST